MQLQRNPRLPEPISWVPGHVGGSRFLHLIAINSLYPKIHKSQKGKKFAGNRLFFVAPIGFTIKLETSDDHTSGIQSSWKVPCIPRTNNWFLLSKSKIRKKKPKLVSTLNVVRLLIYMIFKDNLKSRKKYAP